MTATFGWAKADVVTIEYRVLGPLEVLRDGDPVVLGGPKQRSLLAGLLAMANEIVSADRLIEEVWGGQTSDGAPHTLQVHISDLRKLLEPAHEKGQPWTAIETVPGGYRLNVDPDHFDLQRFEALAETGRHGLDDRDADAAAASFNEALDLWRGRPFGDLDSTSVLAAEVTRLEELRLATLEHRIEADLRRGRHAELIGELHELADAHPFREGLRAQLMLSLYRAGRQTEALACYGSFSRTLGEELGLEPGPELKRLEEQILLQDPSLVPGSTTRRGGNNLPAPTTSFVGRDKERDDARRLLDESRLLTFTGTGGVGKTRLALETATEVIADYPDGVWLVELAALRDPDLVAQTAAKVLKVDIQPDRPVEVTLAEQLSDRTLLLILDNCEHLIDASAHLVDTLLHACPDLKVCATSREPLGVQGESQFRVAPLTTPEDETLSPGRLLEGYESVRLFVDRATAWDPSFSLNEENAPALASICRRLDGIPLALELAGVRAGALTLQQIAEGLDHRFTLLTTGSRTSEERQQTLEATLDWSYDLLTEEEQAMLRWISVCRGTFGFESVVDLRRSMSGNEDGTLDLISVLVAKSLVTAVRSRGEMRYELLETIRQYARHKLTAAGEQKDVFDWHRGWFVALAEEAVPRLRGEEQLEWLQRLEAENDNLRAVLDRSYANGDMTTTVRLAGSLSWFWFLHSYLREGSDWLERLIPKAEKADPLLAARLLIAAGQFAWRDGKEGDALQFLENALGLAREIDSPLHTGWTLAYLALFATMEARYEDGVRFAGEAYDVFEALGNLGGAGFSMWTRACAVYLGQRTQATPDQETVAEATTIMLNLLPAARAVGDRNFLGHLWYSLGVAAVDQGDHKDAADHLRESLQAFRELGNKACTGHTLDQVARLAVARQQPELASEILAATSSLRERLGIPGHLFERHEWQECKAEVDEMLNKEALNETWDEGFAMGFDEAVDHALEALGE